MYHIGEGADKEMNRAKVQNPLTIIAIFAGIAEVAGTAVLIGLPLEIQRLFVWFVMIFPVSLVLIFFVVLIFRREVLYAPSDFVNEELFMQLARKQHLLNKTSELIYETAEKQKSGKPEEVARSLADIQGVLGAQTLEFNDLKSAIYANKIVNVLSQKKSGIMKVQEIADTLNVSHIKAKMMLYELSLGNFINFDGESATLIRPESA